MKDIADPAKPAKYLHRDHQYGAVLAPSNSMGKSAAKNPGSGKAEHVPSSSEKKAT